jgi:general secretion pathway protein E/type IV pilus assembly protein PilB
MSTTLFEQPMPVAVFFGADELQQFRSVLDQGGSMEDVASALNLGSAEVALSALAQSLGMQVADLSQRTVDPEAVARFPAKLVHRYRVFPLGQADDCLLVVTSDPFNLHAIDAVSAAVGQRVTALLAMPDEVDRLIKSHLGVGAETIDDLIAQKLDTGDVEMLDELQFDESEASEMAKQASVVRLVNEILTEAVQVQASDIHIEAQELGIKIRYRIDGVLQRQPTPPEMNRFHAAIVSRLKIMAKMNIAEKRVPQDGRIKLRVCGREIDIRVSVIPMLHGEGIVMRVLDKDRMRFSLPEIGMPDDVHENFGRLIRLPHGIILVTGPTGSGKTTTLYSALNEIKCEDTKIITTEDPIEYQLEGINQIQVHPKVGLTFSASLRSILRHDPDVVLVGEIRDLETAESATQASLTGHLVFIPATVRYGGRTVPRQQHDRRRHGPAAGADTLPTVQGGVSARSPRSAVRFSSRRIIRNRQFGISGRRLPSMSGDRLCRPCRHLRTADGGRPDPATRL